MEDIIRSHPAVDEAVVLAKQNSCDLGAFVVKIDDLKINESNIICFIKGTITIYFVIGLVLLRPFSHRTMQLFRMICCRGRPFHY